MKFNDNLYGFIVENTFTTMPEIGRELFAGIPGVSLLPDLFFKNQVTKDFEKILAENFLIYYSFLYLFKVPKYRQN